MRFLVICVVHPAFIPPWPVNCSAATPRRPRSASYLHLYAPVLNNVDALQWKSVRPPDAYL